MRTALHFVWLVLFANSLPALEVRGFGSGSLGGSGGQQLSVTRLDDDPIQPLRGSLRWALNQPGPRLITFAVAGTITLQDSISILHGQLTVDGTTAPGQGVCVRGGGLSFFRCRDVILTGFRVRLGDQTVRRQLRRDDLDRPKYSGGLDCISLRECQNVVLDHLSLSWSCDELLSVIRCQNVSVQWCLLAEPLGHPRLHPYGDNHAYGILASASTLSIHHCVLSHYWMRGPQFEANDTRRGDSWPVRMEAVANVFSDFGRSGSRVTAGVEDHRDQAKKKSFSFHLVGNAYLDSAGTGRPIEIVTKHDIHPGVRLFQAANFQLRPGRVFTPIDPPRTDQGDLIDQADLRLRKQWVSRPLFQSPFPPTPDLYGTALQDLLEQVGCSHQRDAADQRIIKDLLLGKSRPSIRSQRQVGGWPRLSR